MDNPTTPRVFRSAEHEDIRYVCHPCFRGRKAEREWADGWEPADEREFAVGHMLDDLTRECARRMHYAAYRAHRAKASADRSLWRARYFAMRDRVVLGNRKLIFGAVRKKLYQNQNADDLIGDCYIVMIRAVAAFNPWMGIRFSTYTYTCLMRALSRMAQRSMADRLSQSLSLDQVLGDEPSKSDDHSLSNPGGPKIEEFLKTDHTLLTDREKTVIKRRFQLVGGQGESTLEKVGADLGISKERVRQVQATAIEKLRNAIVGAAAV